MCDHFSVTMVVIIYIENILALPRGGKLITTIVVEVIEVAIPVVREV